MRARCWGAPIARATLSLPRPAAASCRQRLRHGQRGLSLVELLVSLLIGLMVAGAVAAVYLGSARSGRQLKAMAQITEDAQLALALLRRDLQAAGTAEPTGVVATSLRLAAPAPALAVFGCAQGFADTRAAVGMTACAAPAPGGNAQPGTPALEVTFQATADITVGAAGSGDAVDCLGTAVMAGQLTSHRYFVAPGPSGRNELYCASAATAGQALVENVEALEFTLGEASGWSATDPATHRPVRYVPAGSVTDWAQVVSVRLCVLMRSGFPVFTTEDDARYRDCAGVLTTPPDRHLYRAFFSTAALRNRGGF